MLYCVQICFVTARGCSTKPTKIFWRHLSHPIAPQPLQKTAMRFKHYGEAPWVFKGRHVSSFKANDMHVITHHLTPSPPLSGRYTNCSLSPCRRYVHRARPSMDPSTKNPQAEKHIPPELKLVSLFGYTLGGFYLARYNDSPVGAFDEVRQHTSPRATLPHAALLQPSLSQ